MSLTEPLRVLPGSRFTCHGDGLCCTDMHAWGPLHDDEAAFLRELDERVVLVHGDALVLAGGADGRCVFSSPEGCALHGSLGPKGKPKTCQQFPFVLVATPTGGRIATEHRCPCRTMGEREPVTAERGREACDYSMIDRLIASGVALDDETEIDMATWEAIEAPFLSGEATIDDEPFTGGDWQALGRQLLAESTSTRFERALRAFGAALIGEPLPPIGWDDAFDRAEARSAPRDPEEMLSEFVLDAIWSMDWAFHSSWAQARVDLASRIVIARRLAAQLGGRPDRAMAEAIAIIEMTGMADDYTAFIGKLRV
ncbi:MAG: YkgJ family cysteine cluster protein [Sandaracinaceae bacterium]|nr:YkgJ family cysteine cluster protein [Sandaracinaceae bacterium]